MSNTETDQIQLYQKYMFFYVCAHFPIYAIGAFLFGFQLASTLVLQLILLLIAFVAMSLYKKQKELSLDLSSISIALTPGVLVYMLEGHEWQLDAHMYFFAVLAMIVGFKSLRAAIIAAGAIAIHHLSLNFLMPYALYSDGADFFRVVFHAVIVIVETAVILYIIQSLLKNDAKIQAETEIARQALEDANDAKLKQEEAEKKSKEEKRQTIKNITVDFDEQVGGLIQSLTSSSTALQKTAESLLSIADKTSDDSKHVAGSSTQASANVNTVASAMEEMSSTASEISRQITDVKTKSGDTANNAKTANTTVSNLNQLAENIGEVVTSIRDIADQTNLLALNATIEAARAGEAGKGFAVVADEVKKLASETAEKTEEIDTRVTEIQDATKESVIAMERIISNISEIDGSVTNVSAAVEEQNAATAEIVRSVAEASQSVQMVSEIIINVQKSTTETGESSNAVLTSAVEVAKLSDSLKTAVDKFLKQIQS